MKKIGIIASIVATLLAFSATAQAQHPGANDVKVRPENGHTVIDVGERAFIDITNLGGNPGYQYTVAISGISEKIVLDMQRGYCTPKTEGGSTLFITNGIYCSAPGTDQSKVTFQVWLNTKALNMDGAGKKDFTLDLYYGAGTTTPIHSTTFSVYDNSQNIKLDMLPAKPKYKETITFTVSNCTPYSNVTFNWIKQGSENTEGETRTLTANPQGIISFSKGGSNATDSEYFDIATYTMTASCGDTKSAKKTFTLSAGDISISFNPTTQLKDPSAGGIPIAEHNFYDYQDIDIQTAGCSGQVDIKIYKSPACNDSASSCRPSNTGSPNEEKTLSTNRNGEASWNDKKFSASDDTSTYLIEATCQSTQSKASAFLRSFRRGKEFIRLPEKIIKDQPWDVLIGGLDNETGELIGDYESCYFLQLKRREDGTTTYIQDGDGGSCDNTTLENVQNKIDSKYRDADSEERYIRAGSNWDPESSVGLPGLDTGTYELRLYRVHTGGDDSPAQATFRVCEEGDTDPECINTNGAISEPTPTPEPAYAPCAVAFKYIRDDEGYVLDIADNRTVDSNAPGAFERIPLNNDTPTREELDDFMKDKDGCLEVNTALGGISSDPMGFIRSVMAVLLSLSGGIALILIIMSGYKLMTSRGDPEKIQGAKDRLTSAIIGLLFIIFSLVIVEIIGVDILAIPGFGR